MQRLEEWRQAGPDHRVPAARAVRAGAGPGALLAFRLPFQLLFLLFLVAYLAFQAWVFARESAASDYIASILMSAALAGLVGLFPLATRDPFAPPRLMAALFLVFFPLYSLLYLGVPDLSKWYSQYFSSSEFDRKVAFATLHTVMALPIFLLGYLAGERGATAAPARAPDPAPTGLGFALMVAVVGLGIAGMLAYAQSIGGLRTVIDQMQSIFSRRAWRETGSGASYYLGMTLLTAPAVLALMVVHTRRSRLALAAAIGLMLLGSGLLLVTQASREKSIFPLILFVTTLLLLSRGSPPGRARRRARWLAALSLGMLVLAFAVQTAFRWSDRTSPGMALVDALSDFNRIDISIVMFVDYFDFRSGNDLMWGVPLLAYPNQVLVRLFDATPLLNTSALLHDFIFSGDVNAGYPGAPLVGELFLNFGYAGYALFLPLGFWFGRAHSRLRLGGHEFWAVLSYAATLYFVMFKFCIYIGLSESVLLMILVYSQLFVWKRLFRLRL